MKLSTLTALSPIDGRYRATTEQLALYMSEYALMRYRVIVEIKWLLHLSREPSLPEIPHIDENGAQFLMHLIESFSEEDATRIKAIEADTRHDVKAIEYFIKEKLASHDTLKTMSEFVHFSCTSEDINNLSYALMLKAIRSEKIAPAFEQLITTLKQQAKNYANQPMLARTHGQPATPTTMGKEFANVAHRLERQFHQFTTIEVLGKMNGATGNFNAHLVAFPEVNWINISQSFIEGMGLSYNPYTTQIEPHDAMAEYFQCLSRMNTILIDFSRDIWGYIALNYFQQTLVDKEVGSSTMPHKINPIDFENAEGNAGIANALFQHFATKLPISRWQRDLSDSTVLRTMGTALGHTSVALASLQKGLGKLTINTVQIEKDLNDNWEVLGEALQTVMRKYGIDSPYEKLKTLTRGKRLDQKELHDFIKGLDLPNEVKEYLYTLTPLTYTGLANTLAKTV